MSVRSESVGSKAGVSTRQRLLREGLAARRGCLLANLGGEVATTSPPLRDALRAGYESWRGPLAELFGRGQTEGSIRSDLPAAELADFFLDVWEGALLRMKIEGGSTRPLNAGAIWSPSFCRRSPPDPGLDPEIGAESPFAPLLPSHSSRAAPRPRRTTILGGRTLVDPDRLPVVVRSFLPPSRQPAPRYLRSCRDRRNRAGSISGRRGIASKRTGDTN